MYFEHLLNTLQQLEQQYVGRIFNTGRPRSVPS